MLKFGENADKKLNSLIKFLPKGGKVLDLGSGLGGNSIFLVGHGFRLTCLDKDKEVVKVIKKENPKINAINKDILEFDFPKNEYDLVLILNVLHFFNLPDIKSIIKRIMDSLKTGGLLYLEVFSTKDSLYKKFLKVSPKTKGTTFCVNKEKQRFIHFFTKEELANFFAKHKILEIKEFIVKDNHLSGGKHEHGIISLIVKKLPIN